MEALIARHKVERIVAEVALPGYSLVTSIGWKALRLLTLIADDVATVEATLTAADGSHAVLDKVHQSGALEAEEVVEFVRTLLTLDMFEQAKGKLVAEHEEVGAAVRALDEC